MTHDEIREYFALRKKYSVGHTWVRDMVERAKEALRDHSISTLDQDRDRAKDLLRLAYLTLLYQEIPDQDLVVIRDGNVVLGMQVWRRDKDGPRLVVMDGVERSNAKHFPNNYSVAKPVFKEVITYVYED